ncbi:MAG: hypothetical protein ACI9BD_000006 [Candidatus Marinamargulisbacteria bacterium]|jgi:hypothetical protein
MYKIVSLDPIRVSAVKTPDEAPSFTGPVSEGSSPEGSPNKLSEIAVIDDFPKDFYCPISLQVMFNPVTDQFGHTYERSFIEEWTASNKTSPLTGLDYNMPPVFTPSDRLKAEILDWARTHGTILAQPDVPVTTRSAYETLCNEEKETYDFLSDRLGNRLLQKIQTDLRTQLRDQTTASAIVENLADLFDPPVFSDCHHEAPRRQIARQWTTNLIQRWTYAFSDHVVPKTTSQLEKQMEKSFDSSREPTLVVAGLLTKVRDELADLVSLYCEEAVAARLESPLRIALNHRYKAYIDGLHPPNHTSGGDEEC